MVRYSETHPMYLLFMGTCLGKLCPCHQLCTVLDAPLRLWSTKFTFMLQVSVRASPPSWKTLTSKEKPLFQLLRKQLHPELTDLSHDFMCQTKCHFHEPIQQYWRFPWRAGVQIHTPPCCTRGPQRTWAGWPEDHQPSLTGGQRKVLREDGLDLSTGIKGSQGIAHPNLIVIDRVQTFDCHTGKGGSEVAAMPS